MEQNRRQIAAEMIVAERPDWNKIALLLDRMGLHDAKGNPPTAQTARLTWRAVRDARALPVARLAQPVVLVEQPKSDDAAERRLEMLQKDIKDRGQR